MTVSSLAIALSSAAAMKAARRSCSVISASSCSLLGCLSVVTGMSSVGKYCLGLGIGGGLYSGVVGNSTDDSLGSYLPKTLYQASSSVRASMALGTGVGIPVIWPGLK